MSCLNLIEKIFEFDSILIKQSLRSIFYLKINNIIKKVIYMERLELVENIC